MNSMDYLSASQGVFLANDKSDKNDLLRSSVSKYLSVKGRRTEHIVARSAHKAIITEKYPLRRINNLVDINSLSFRSNYRKYNRRDLGSVNIEKTHAKWTCRFASIFQFALLTSKIKFEARRLVYRISGGHAHDFELHHLRSLSNLKHLDLSYLRFITDTGLCEIGKLSQLEHLNLAHCCNISGKGLLNLRNLHNLESIDLTGQKPYLLKCAGALDLFASIPNLNSIKFGTLSPMQLKVLSEKRIRLMISTAKVYNLGNSDLDNITNFFQLKELTLSYNQMHASPAGLLKLGELTNLEKLDLALLFTQNPQPKEIFDFIEALTRLPKLNTLKIKGHLGGGKEAIFKLSKVLDLTLEVFQKFRAEDFCSLFNLKSLDIESITTGDGKGWPNKIPLESLRVRKVDTLISLESLRNLPHLKSLDLSRSELPQNFDWSQLADLQHLESLNLNHLNPKIENNETQLDEEGHCGYPFPFPSLLNLSLCNCELSEDNFNLIARMPNLRYLNLTRARYNEANLKQLQKAKPGLHIEFSENFSIGFFKRMKLKIKFLARSFLLNINFLFYRLLRPKV